MEVLERTIEYYFTSSGHSPFREWFYSLKREEDRGIIRARLVRVRRGNFGDCEHVEEGVFELRIHVGPGFRVYFGKIGNKIILLLLGGIKKNQSKDISSALSFWADHRGRIK
jgi:putative addiction module killer protein